MRAIITGLLAVAILSLALSCGKKGVPPGDNETPSMTIEIVSGNNQTDTAKAVLRDSLVVRVVNSVTGPAVGDTVWFEQITPQDAGGVTYPWRLTNALGYARTFYHLDSLMGVDTVKVVSSGAGDTAAVYFQITVTPGRPDKIIQVSPQGLDSGTAGQALPNPVIAEVTDRYGNPSPGIYVYFKASNRGLAETDSSARHPYETDSAFTVTDQRGYARATWVLTINPDPNFGYPNYVTLRAFTAEGDTVRFSAAAYPPGTLKYYYDIRSIFADNCFACHPGLSDYRQDFYYELEQNNNVIPGDTTSNLLSHVNPMTHPSNINTVEEDMVIRWVVTDSAAPGSSGLNNYHDNMKPIFDASCISCHSGVSPPGDYLLTGHKEIRGVGSDAVSNAIAGDTTSLLVVKMKERHNWVNIDPDSLVAAALADSIIRWVVTDSLRDY
jgi:hypothetical protein